MSDLGAVILAAGISSRMGQFKPLLRVDGQTMARRVVDYMRSAGAAPVIVVTGYRAEELERHLDGSGARFVRNERYYETQMLDSILLGASALSDEVQRILLSPADVPLVKPETIRMLLHAEGTFVRPCCHGRPGHPVVISRSLLEAVGAYEGDGGLQGAIDALGIAPLDIDAEDQGTVLDGDTRDEYAALLKYRRQETGRPQPIQLDLRISLQAETSFWDARSAQLLELIQTTGSILSACQCMHMSYSKGWAMINEAERQLGYALLVRNQGGSNGGGSELTGQGAALLNAYQNMCREIEAESHRIFEAYFPMNRQEE